MKRKTKTEKRKWRHKRVRAKITGAAKVPRFCVFRSAKHIYAQLIDDEKGKTIVAVRDQELKGKKRIEKIETKNKKLKSEKEKVIRKGKLVIAFEVGKLIAEKAKKEKIEKVVFDRGGYQYHGRVKALAEGAREGGLRF